MLWFLIGTTPIWAASGTWTALSAGDASGNWDTAGNWSGNTIADGSGSAASFNLDITVDSTIDFDSSHTLGTLTFTDATTPSNNWTLTSSNNSVLTLASGSTPVINVTNQTTTIGLVLDGTQGFSKLGAGTLVLTATNLYTGATSIGAGTLSIGSDGNLGNASNTITLAGGTLLTTANLSSARNVTLSGVSAINVSTGTTFSLSGNMTGTGGFTKTGAGILQLSGSNAYSGGTALNTGTIQATAVNAFSANSAFTMNTGTTLDLNGFDQTVASFVGGSLTTTGGTLTPGGTISLGSATLTFGSNNTGGVYAGVISGTGSLVKLGSGTLSMSGSSTYSGGTTILNGTIHLTSTVSRLGSGLVTLGDTTGGGSVRLAIGGSAGWTFTNSIHVRSGPSSAALQATIQGTGNDRFTYSGNIQLDRDVILSTGGTNGSLSFANFAGIISGVGGLNIFAYTVGDRNPIILSNAGNSFNGGITISTGLLTMSVSNAIPVTNDVVIANHATAKFVLNGFSQNIGSLSGGGTTGGTVSLVGAVLTTGGNNTDTTFSGVINGAGTLAKTGTGTQAFDGDNTMTGTLAVNQGIVKITGINGSMAASTTTTLRTAAVLLLDNVAALNTDRLNDSGTVSFNGGLLQLVSRTDDIDTTETIGTVNILSGVSTIDLQKSSNPLAATVLTISTLGAHATNSAAVLNFTNSGGEGTLGGAGAGQVRMLINAGVTADDLIGGWATVNGSDFAYYDSTGGTGVQELGTNLGPRPDWSNSPTGNVLVTSNAPAALTGSAAVNSLAVNTTGGSTLDLGTQTLTIAIGGLLTAGTSNLTITNGSLASGTGSLWVWLDGGTTTLAARLTDNSGAVQLVKSGAGLLVLSNTNQTYTGGTTIHQGTLRMAGANLLPTGGDLTLGTAAGILLDLDGFDQTIGALSGGGVDGGNVSLGAAALTFGDATNVTFSGTISGTTLASLIKVGAGTENFTGSSDFAGTLNVQQGTLRLSTATGTLSNLSALSISGGTLLLDSSAGVSTNRIANAAPITFKGGTLNMTFAAGGAGTETIGDVTVASGQAIFMNTTSGTLTMASLTRTDANAGVVFGNHGSGLLGSTSKILISDLATSGILGPWAVTATTSADVVRDFAYYDSTNGVMELGTLAGARPALPATGDVSATGSGYALAGVTALTLSGTTAAKTVNFNGGVQTLNLGNQSLVLTEGGLLHSSGSALTISSTTSGNLVAGGDGTSSATLWIWNSSSTISFSSTAHITNNGTGVVSVVLGGATAVGTVTFAGTNSYTGDTIINGGVLNMAINGAIAGDVRLRTGTLNAASSVTTGIGAGKKIYLGIAGGGGSATVAVSALTAAYANDIIVEGGTATLASTATGTTSTPFFSGNITLDGNLILAASTDATSTLAIRGTITGSGGITKTNAGIVLLGNSATNNNANTYSGDTLINAGILRVGKNNALGPIGDVTIATGATLDLTSGGNSFDQTVGALAGGGTLSLGIAVFTFGDSENTTYTGAITGPGQLAKQGTGTVVLSSTNNTYAGISISDGVLSVSTQANLGATSSAITLAGGTLHWTGNSETLSSSHTYSTTSASSAIEVSHSLTTLTLNSNMTGTLGSLTKLGAGRLELAGASNSYDGTTTIQEGTLHIIGTLTSGGNVVAVGAGGTLQGTGLTSIQRNVTVTGNGTLSFAGGAIGGTLTATGGTWTGNGSVGGAITINPGTFTLSSGSTLTASGLTTINTSGILNLGGTLSGSASLAGGTISGSGGTITGTLAVTGGSWSGTGTVNGAITATSDTFHVLTGATLNNAIAATVTGSATLSVNGTIAGGVIVNNGGTLHGNGTIGGPVTVNSGGFLSAGNSVGHLTVDDDMTWNGGSNQVFEISNADMLGTPGTDWDLITVNGELTLNATPSSKLNLTFDSWPPGDPLDNFDSLDNYSWLWITTTGGIDVGGYLVDDIFNITLGPEFAGDFSLVDVNKFNVSLSPDGLNMLVNYTFNVVPEPGSLLLASLAASGLGVYGRRRSLLLTTLAAYGKRRRKTNQV